MASLSSIRWLIQRALGARVTLAGVVVDGEGARGSGANALSCNRDCGRTASGALSRRRPQ